jgi:hypothetical protein
MTDHDDLDEFEVLAQRAGQSVRAEAGAADAHLGAPAPAPNRRKLVLAGAIGLAAVAVVAIVAVTNDDEPKRRVTIASPSTPVSATSTTASPSTTLQSTTLPSTTLPALTTVAPTTLPTIGVVPPLDDVDSWRGTFDEEQDPIDLATLQRMVDERHPAWADDPYAMTMQFARIWFWTADETFDVLETPAPPPLRRTFVVTVPYTGDRGDDSVRAARLTVTFTGGPPWRYESAVATHQCQPGRGHQDFTTAPCI